MLKIFYKTGIYGYQMQEPEMVKAGMVASFCGNRQIRTCRPGRLPCGFFICDLEELNNQPTFNYPANYKAHMTIAVGQGEYQTDEYEDGTYKINDLLYCGGTGKISNSRIYRGNPIIGIVNSVEKNMIGFITVFSNLESLSN